MSRIIITVTENVKQAKLFILKVVDPNLIMDDFWKTVKKVKHVRYGISQMNFYLIMKLVKLFWYLEWSHIKGDFHKKDIQMALLFPGQKPGAVRSSTYIGY